MPGAVKSITCNAGFVTAVSGGLVNYADIQNVTTARLLGRSTAGAGSAEEITIGAGLSLAGGVLSATGGGFTSPLTTRGDLLTRDATTHVRLPIGPANQVLSSTGTDPSWTLIDLATMVGGVLRPQYGGTGMASYTLGDVLYCNVSGAFLAALPGNLTTTRQFLQSTGVGGLAAAPSWTALAAADIPGLPASIITSGTLAEVRGGTNQSAYVLGDILVASAANTLSRLAGNTTAGRQFLRQQGTGTVSALPAWDTVGAADLPDLASTPGGRLTLSSGTPVLTADVPAATTIYYTPYLHNGLALWDGTRWLRTAFAETALALGTLTAARNYDVFGYLSAGALALEALAWSTDTGRATALAVTDGRLTKSGDKTRLYLGTFRTISTTQTCWIVNPAPAAGGAECKLFVWNAYNRVPVQALMRDSSANWSYATAAWRAANNSPTARVDYVAGQAGDAVTAGYNCLLNPLGGNTALAGVGVDSSTAMSGLSNSFSGLSATVGVQAVYGGVAQLGYHWIYAIEKAASGVTVNYYGNQGAGADYQSGLLFTGRA